jgi:hypothetical protein
MRKSCTGCKHLHILNRTCDAGAQPPVYEVDPVTMRGSWIVRGHDGSRLMPPAKWMRSPGQPCGQYASLYSAGNRWTRFIHWLLL